MFELSFSLSYYYATRTANETGALARWELIAIKKKEKAKKEAKKAAEKAATEAAAAAASKKAATDAAKSKAVVNSAVLAAVTAAGNKKKGTNTNVFKKDGVAAAASKATNTYQPPPISPPN